MTAETRAKARDWACVSDPLPPSAALPLCKGENECPLAKGDGREAAGGCSHSPFGSSLQNANLRTPHGR